MSTGTDGSKPTQWEVRLLCLSMCSCPTPGNRPLSIPTPSAPTSAWGKWMLWRRSGVSGGRWENRSPPLSGLKI
eukprot:4654407-Pyramimonas_sp.AAC.1